MPQRGICQGAEIPSSIQLLYTKMDLPKFNLIILFFKKRFQLKKDKTNGEGCNIGFVVFVRFNLMFHFLGKGW